MTTETTEIVYDVFVSYVEADYGWVDGYLLDALKAAGVTYYSEDAFEVGKPRIIQFEAAIKKSKYTLLVISPDYLVDNASQFLRSLGQSYGMDKADTWPVIPLLLRPAELPSGLAQLELLDATDPDRWPKAIERLCAQAQRPLPEPPKPPPCPYPGMVPFDETNVKQFFFYGREREVADLRDRLRVGSFVAIIGASGSGKSSLVRAGLVPELLEKGDWAVKIMRPGAAPLDALNAALSLQPTPAGADGAAPPGDPPLAQAVAGVLAAQPGTQHLLILVDQFEEIFTVAKSGVAPFQQQLLRLTDTPGCAVVLTARADFYADLMASPLWREIQNNRVEVTPLGEEGLRKAIVEPAAKVGVAIAGELVERLVHDAADEPGVLPLVQETLVVLWERLERRYLPLRAYETLSGDSKDGNQTGLQVAIARRAQQTLNELTDEQQTIARRIFLRLVQFVPGRADTRRQQPVAKLRAGDEPALFEQTLQRLTDSRLITLSGGEGGQGKQADISHEALIRGWPQLKMWLDERRASELTRRRLEDRATDWVRLGGGDKGLLDPFTLEEAERWRDSIAGDDVDPDLAQLIVLSRAAVEQAEYEKEQDRQHDLEVERQRREEQERLVASERKRREDQEAANQRQRRYLAFLAGAMGVAVLAALAAGGFGVQASRSQANTVRARATAERNAADAQTAQAIALANEREAKRQRTSADNSAAAARSAQALAVERQQDAEEQRGVARRQSRLAIARQLAAQSFKTPQDNLGLALLLSLEAIHIEDTVDTHASLLAALQRQPGVRLFPKHHSATVWSVAFSPDGQILASASADRSIVLWDAATRRPLGEPLIGHTDQVNSVAFSPDGKLLASGGDDGFVMLWDVATHQRLSKFESHTDAVYSVAFSPDGKLLASGSYDTTIILWDVAAARSLGEPLQGHAGGVNSVAFSPDGKLLASADSERTIILWDVATRRPLTEPLASEAGVVSALAFSPDGKTLAAGNYTNSVVLWDVESRKPRPDPLQVGVPINAVAFAHNSPYLAISHDNGASLWNVTTLDVWPLNSGGQSAVAFSPDDTDIALGSNQGIVSIWDPFGGSPLAQTIAPAGMATSVALSKDSKTLAIGICDAVDQQKGTCTSAAIELWDVTAQQQIGASLPGYTSTVTALAFSPDGKTLASGTCVADPCTRSEIRLWDVGSQRPFGGPLQGHTGAITSLVYSPDGKTLASGSKDSTIMLWDIAGHRTLSGHASAVESLAFSPDGARLASGSCVGRDCVRGEIRLWDVALGQQVGSTLIGHQKSVGSLAFSPDGKTLASSGLDGTLLFWDLATRKRSLPLRLATGHGSDSINIALAFSKDGTTLAASQADKTLFWDVASRREVSELDVDGGVGAFFSSDDQTLVVASGYVVALWDLRLERWKELACQIVTENLSQADWNQYVGAGLPYNRTCPNLPADEEVPPPH